MGGGFFGLVRKQLVESRWVLGISSLALFAFGWLGVFAVAMAQLRFKKEMANLGKDPAAFVRLMVGEGVQVTTGMIEMSFWLHPFVWLPVIVWAISRGSIAVAGEVERGTIDVVMSRPIRRSTYLFSQIVVAVFGILLLAGFLLLGNVVGTRYNAIESPPTAWDLLRPAALLAGLGVCVFGYTLLLSSWDVVRWRPIMVSSTWTIASFAAFVVSQIPALAKTPWETWMKRLSLFTAFDPIDAIGTTNHLARNLEILSAIGLAGAILSLFVFAYRDIPTNS